MRTLTYREAIREGLDEELARDPNVLVTSSTINSQLILTAR